MTRLHVVGGRIVKVKPRRLPRALSAFLYIAGITGLAALLGAGVAIDQQRTADPTVFVKFWGGYGSGFYIGDRLIVTAAHGGAPAYVMQRDEQRIEVQREIVSPELDIQVLRIMSGDITTPAAVTTCEPAKIGAPISISGAPLGWRWTTIYGAVAGDPTLLVDRRQSHEVQLVSAPVTPGISGGPVRDWRGRVVGMAEFVLTQNNDEVMFGIGGVVPYRVVCQLLESMGK